MRPNAFFGQALGVYNEINTVPGEVAPTVSYRHRYLCWACRCSGVMEFEPDATEPSYTECHQCGIDNEIPPGLHEQPAIISGQVPTRII